MLLVPKPEGDDPEMRAGLAPSKAEDEANWRCALLWHLAAVIRTSAMEEEARQAVEDAEA